MADKSTEHDKQVLHKLGYAQELSRRMGGFSNFAISFSIINILAGGISAFYAAFNSAGAGGAFIGWLVGGFFSLMVAFSMGQIASAYPTAGGLYHWASILGGKFLGWIAAWFNLLGLLFVVSSVDVFLYQVFFKGLLVDTVLGGNFLGMDSSTWNINTQHIFVIIVLATQALFNHYGINLTTKLTDFSGYLIFVLTVVFVIALFAYSPVPLDFSRLVTFTNYTGEPGGNVIPNAVPSLFLAFFFGLIYVMYTITGFDASGHTSDPRDVRTVLERIAVEEEVARNRPALDTGKDVPGKRSGGVAVDEIGALERRLDPGRAPVGREIAPQAEARARARIREDVAEREVGFRQYLGIEEGVDEGHAPDALAAQHQPGLVLELARPAVRRHPAKPVKRMPVALNRVGA